MRERRRGLSWPSKTNHQDRLLLFQVPTRDVYRRLPFSYPVPNTRPPKMPVNNASKTTTVICEVL